MSQSFTVPRCLRGAFREGRREWRRLRNPCGRCGQPYGRPGNGVGHGPGYCIDRRQTS